MEAAELAKIANRLGAIQHPDELEIVIETIWSLNSPVRVVVELGSCLGGSLRLWSTLADSTALLISVDDKVTSPTVGSIPESDYCQRLANCVVQEQQHLEVVLGNTMSCEVVQVVEDKLDGRLIDFLFIDAGHRYWEVAADLYNFGKFISVPSVIALHDAAGTYTSWVGVPLVWAFLEDYLSREMCQLVLGLPPLVSLRPMGTGIICITHETQRDLFLEAVQLLYSTIESLPASVK